MKTALILACVALGFVGCSTNNNRGGVGPAAETTEGRAYGWQNDVQARDPRGPWANWRYGGDTSRITPRVPTGAGVRPPGGTRATVPSPPVAAPSGGVGAGVQSTTTPSYIYYNYYQRSEEVEVQEPRDPRSFWDRFRYVGGPDQTSPRLPLDPIFPPAPVSSSYDP